VGTVDERLIVELRRKRNLGLEWIQPPAVGEFSYDTLLEILPVYHVVPSPGYPPAFKRYGRILSHVGHPAPGRESNGVHEWGYGRLDPDMLCPPLHEIPTITAVEVTFDR
jgi:hypothetical protein